MHYPSLLQTAVQEGSWDQAVPLLNPRHTHTLALWDCAAGLELCWLKLSRDQQGPWSCLALWASPVILGDGSCGRWDILNTTTVDYRQLNPSLLPRPGQSPQGCSMGYALPGGSSVPSLWGRVAGRLGAPSSPGHRQGHRHVREDGVNFCPA